jgi:hypothetical protein
LGEHTISFFVPANCPKSAIFAEAVEVAGSGYQPYQDVPKYLLDEHPRYSDYKSRTGRICIDACVEGSRAMNREEQLCFLGQNRLEMATLPDLIVAHALFYVATGRSLFGAPDAEGFTSRPRAVGGSLNFENSVLRVQVDDRYYFKGRVWVASARIRS